MRPKVTSRTQKCYTGVDYRPKRTPKDPEEPNYYYKGVDVGPGPKDCSSPGADLCLHNLLKRYKGVDL